MNKIIGQNLFLLINNHKLFVQSVSTCYPWFERQFFLKLKLLSWKLELSLVKWELKMVHLSCVQTYLKSLKRFFLPFFKIDAWLNYCKKCTFKYNEILISHNKTKYLRTWCLEEYWDIFHCVLLDRLERFVAVVTFLALQDFLSHFQFVKEPDVLWK